MEGANNRYVIPVYQRKYDWKIENCRQLYEDLKKVSRVCNFLWAARSRLIDVGGDSVTK